MNNPSLLEQNVPTGRGGLPSTFKNTNSPRFRNIRVGLQNESFNITLKMISEIDRIDNRKSYINGNQSDDQAMITSIG